MTTLTKQTLALCLLSGLLSGLAYIWLRPEISTPDLEWDKKWVDLIPGIVFGALFAVLNIKGMSRKLLFVLGSALACFIAGRIFFALVSPLKEIVLIAIALGGAVAGTFGAFVLAYGSRMLNGMRFGKGDTRTLIAGAVAGIVFVNIIYWGMIGTGGLEETTVPWLVAFPVWQVAVGWFLTRGLQGETR